MARTGQNYYAARQAEQARIQASVDQDQEMIPLIRGREVDAGDLSGDEVEGINASFTYFGSRFRVNPDLTELMVVDLLEQAEVVGDAEDPRALTAAKGYVRGHLHPEDFDAFWTLVLAKRQGLMQVMRVCHRLLEQITERPTSAPSASSAGRRDTKESSPAGASAPVIESAPAAPTGGSPQEVAQHFITKFEGQGRPDLAAQMAIAAEAREAQGLATV